jgi:hypothetical protein
VELNSDTSSTQSSVQSNSCAQSISTACIQQSQNACSGSTTYQSTVTVSKSTDLDLHADHVSCDCVIEPIRSILHRIVNPFAQLNVFYDVEEHLILRKIMDDPLKTQIGLKTEQHDEKDLTSSSSSCSEARLKPDSTNHDDHINVVDIDDDIETKQQTIAFTLIAQQIAEDEATLLELYQRKQRLEQLNTNTCTSQIDSIASSIPTTSSSAVLSSSSSTSVSIPSESRSVPSSIVKSELNSKRKRKRNDPNIAEVETCDFVVDQQGAWSTKQTNIDRQLLE